MPGTFSAWHLLTPNTIYHVYCRTARGERVFAVTTEADAFIETLRAVRGTDKFTILAYVSTATDAIVHLNNAIE